jgi:pectinesterase
MHTPHVSSTIVAAIFMLAVGRTCAAEDYYVDSDGHGRHSDAAHTFTSVQASLAAIQAGTAAEPNRIFINPGNYKEHLSIDAPRSNLTLIGLGSDPTDVMLTWDLSAKSPKAGGGTVGTTGSSSTTIAASNFTAVNLTFANSTPQGVAQAVALKTTGDKLAFRNCRFIGFQDTLYVTAGRDYFKDCFITGTVDFIFGNATAVFDHCTINCSGSGVTTITAANTKPGTAIGMVFINCRITGEANADRGTFADGPPAGSVYLGRSWQYTTSSSSVAFLNTTMGSEVNPAGWLLWKPQTDAQAATQTRYSEYQSVDTAGKAVDNSKRVAWSHQFTDQEAARFTLDHLFGSAKFWGDRYADWGAGDAWDPTAQLAAVPDQPESTTQK